MGSFAASVADDYTLFDATQTITFTSQPASASPLTCTVTSADPHDFTDREIVALGGLFQSGDRRWGLGADQLAAKGRTPTQGDTILDAAGATWTINGPCVLDDFSISWACGTTKAR